MTRSVKMSMGWFNYSWALTSLW